LDWYSRYVVAWKLHDTLEVSFVLVAVKEAFSLAIPEIMNSDQGSQFTSKEYTELLKETGCVLQDKSEPRLSRKSEPLIAT
jgi:putative transposase